MFPIILRRTPYNKAEPCHNDQKLAELFVEQGDVVVVQDERGKYHSEGIFSPYVNESDEREDTLNWAGKAKWSNGKIALLGFSYLGSCAWLGAVQKK